MRCCFAILAGVILRASSAWDLDHRSPIFEERLKAKYKLATERSRHAVQFSANQDGQTRRSGDLQDQPYHRVRLNSGRASVVSYYDKAHSQVDSLPILNIAKLASSSVVLLPAADKEARNPQPNDTDLMIISTTETAEVSTEAGFDLQDMLPDVDEIMTIAQEFSWTSGVIGAAAAGGIMSVLICGFVGAKRYSAAGRFGDQTESISVYDSESILGADLDEFLN